MFDYSFLCLILGFKNGTGTQGAKDARMLIMFCGLMVWGQRTGYSAVICGCSYPNMTSDCVNTTANVLTDVPESDFDSK